MRPRPCRPEPEQLPARVRLRVLSNPIGIAPAPADIHLQVAAFAPAQFLQLSQKRRDFDSCLGIALSNLNEHTDAPCPVRLLRTRPKRPSRRGAAAKQDDEFAPSYA